MLTAAWSPEDLKRGRYIVSAQRKGLTWTRSLAVICRPAATKPTTGILEDVVEELAEDVGEWLREPQMNAQLGDL